MLDGKKLKKLREDAALTQSALGSKIGTDGNLVSRWENERAQPSQHYIIKLAEVFNTSVDSIMKGECSEIKERSITENKGVLVFELDGQRLEVPATAEFSEQFWKRVDKMIELRNNTNKGDIQ